MKYLSNITKFYFIVVALFLSISLPTLVFCQIPGWENKEFSKELSLYYSKKFLVDSVFGHSSNPIYFETDALAASNSGELTTVTYSCDSLRIKGLLLCFWGNYFNKYGTRYMGYSFKLLEPSKADKLFSLIESEAKKFTKRKFTDRFVGFLEKPEKGETCFDFDGMTFLLSGNEDGMITIRIFWNDFDAVWQINAYDKTRKRFANVISKLNY